MSQEQNSPTGDTYKTAQGRMVKEWDEKLTCGKDLAQYIKRHATDKNLDDLGNLARALDEMPRDEQNKFYNSIMPQLVSTAKFIRSSPQSNLLDRFKVNNTKLTLTRFEVASLLANAFLCTFPEGDYPHLSFSRIFHQGGSASQREKIKCMVYYFGAVFNDFDVAFLRGSVTYKRSVVASAPEWRGSSNPMIPMNLVSKGPISQAYGMAQVNFSAREFGGQVLKSEALREEMWCITCPELIVAKLFCNEMKANEAIVVEGVLQFSEFEGIGCSVRCLGPRSEDAYRGPHTVVSIDAVNFCSRHLEQYSKENIDRELLKAFAGFRGVKGITIATGNWGCGAFRGDPVLKAKIQNIAASQASKSLFYYPFNDPALEAQIESGVQFAKPLTVAQAYKELLQWSSAKSGRIQVNRPQPAFRLPVPASQAVNTSQPAATAPSASQCVVQ